MLWGFLKQKTPLRCKGVCFADWTGLEPATSAVTGRHSNQLNYQSVLFIGLDYFSAVVSLKRTAKIRRKMPQVKYLLQKLPKNFSPLLQSLYSLP